MATLPTILQLLQTIKHGQITIKTGDTETAEITSENHKTDINFLQKELFKTLLQLRPDKKGESIRRGLSTVTKLAEGLKQKGYTVTLSLNGKTVVTIGSAADPLFTKWITGTEAIEINNLAALIDLII